MSFSPEQYTFSAGQRPEPSLEGPTTSAAAGGRRTYAFNPTTTEGIAAIESVRRGERSRAVRASQAGARQEAYYTGRMGQRMTEQDEVAIERYLAQHELATFIRQLETNPEAAIKNIVNEYARPYFDYAAETEVANLNDAYRHLQALLSRVRVTPLV